jgi:hypothetical protein
MTTRAIHVVAVTFCSASCLIVAACGQPGGRTFLANKTGINVEEIGVCASAVADNEECRPERFGNGEWEKFPTFPPYSVSENAVRSGDQSVLAEVRTHYLGSPFYAGDVHAFCKQGVDRDVIPQDGTSLQDYELAEVIQDRAVRSLTTKLHNQLQTKASSDRAEVDVDSITRRFQESLNDEVRARVKARLLWFVARYPGGLPDISRNDQLRKCVQEQRENSGATLVTGVAGYVVYNNQIDNALAQETTLYRALDGALAAGGDLTLDPNFRITMAKEWRQDVEKVAQFRMARRDLSTMVWPLWVQFE